MIKIEYHISRNLFHNNDVYLLDRSFDGLPIGGFSVEAMTDSPYEVSLNFLHSLCTGIFWDLIKSVCLNQSKAKVGLFYYTCPLPDNRITRYKKLWMNSCCDDLKILLPNESHGLPEVMIELESELVYATIIPIYEYEVLKSISNYVRLNSHFKIIVSTLDFNDDMQIRSLYNELHLHNERMKRKESLSSFVRFVCGLQNSCVIELFGSCPDDCCVKFSLFAQTETTLWENIERFYETIRYV